MDCKHEQTYTRRKDHKVIGTVCSNSKCRKEFPIKKESKKSSYFKDEKLEEEV